MNLRKSKKKEVKLAREEEQKSRLRFIPRMHYVHELSSQKRNEGRKDHAKCDDRENEKFAAHIDCLMRERAKMNATQNSNHG